MLEEKEAADIASKNTAKKKKHYCFLLSMRNEIPTLTKLLFCV